MSNGSLHLEFANAKAVARARLWRSWGRRYPEAIQSEPMAALEMVST